MASVIDKIGNETVKQLGSSTANKEFMSRTIGMDASYDDIMATVMSFGQKPNSLLGKDYVYIFDHVRRNYLMGTDVMNMRYNDCPKFTFYKERPTVRFANPYEDPMNFLGKWFPNMDFENTSVDNILTSYAESTDEGLDNGKIIGTTYDIDYGNPGVAHGGIESFGIDTNTCDLIGKTNYNFRHGQYRTLIARFHSSADETKRGDDTTQTAISKQYGLSHGRNLLSLNGGESQGYDNPYCRVWTYHHQYNQINRAIRPFGDATSQEELESMEQSGDYNTVGFRTTPNKDFDFGSGSVRLDKHGVLNYKNGFVNIAPTAKISDYFDGGDGGDKKNVSIKNCMFSIENLAWKTDRINPREYDQYGLSAEQKGPLGGRIMWFPPYDLTFSEDVSVNWNSNQFIGRGEKVYTYTDTERRGSLSFTLLIDHPSILDYWTGHKRNGMFNSNGSVGYQLDEGNVGGVDNKTNQENTLLRFFAGCEILSAKPQEFMHRKVPKEDVAPPKEEKVPDTDTHPPLVKKKLYCFAFFPNNYSGKDDFPNVKNGRVNAIHYLLNGIGTQRYLANPSDKVGTDLEVRMDSNVVVSQSGDPISGYGGYEMGDKGISIATNILKNKASAEKSYPISHGKKNENVQYLTDENGDKYVGGYSNKETYYFSKYSSNSALSSSEIGSGNTISLKWYQRRYYYRVDKSTLEQRLLSADSYIDGTSNGYNSERIYGNLAELKKQFNIEEDADVVSLTDMYIGLVGETSVLSSYKNSTKVDLVKKLVNDKDNYKITKVSFHGNASSQDTNVKKSESRNTSLSINRADTLKNWLIDAKFPFPEGKDASSEEHNSIQQGGNMSNVDDKITKLWRSAYVLIEYESSCVENASTAEDVSKTNESGEATMDRVELTDFKRSINTFTAKAYKEFMEKKTWEEAKNGSAFHDTVNSQIFNMNPQPTQSMIDVIEPPTSEDGEETPTEDANSNVETGIVERYDNEGEFFELLERNDPFLHSLITDKIRYFDPAFHSISPEGFNARLTFLHQCTRQGSTVSASDGDSSNTAYNLSFGRPPVCVLRLGDFFYTKIIIHSVSIQYENPQWDLNPEGIGVMPMFAKVNINFVFLGGSDLAGPISRLQNAVSFNYYANTSVYDNRAEMVEYDPNGSGKEVKFKPYSYPDMIDSGGPKSKRKEKEREEMEKLGQKLAEDSNNKNYPKATLLEDMQQVNTNVATSQLLDDMKKKPMITKYPISTTHTIPQVNAIDWRNGNYIIE